MALAGSLGNLNEAILNLLVSDCLVLVIAPSFRTWGELVEYHLLNLLLLYGAVFLKRIPQVSTLVQTESILECLHRVSLAVNIHPVIGYKIRTCRLLIRLLRVQEAELQVPKDSILVIDVLIKRCDFSFLKLLSLYSPGDCKRVIVQ